MIFHCLIGECHGGHCWTGGRKTRRWGATNRNVLWKPGSTIITLLHEKINPKTTCSHPTCRLIARIFVVRGCGNWNQKGLIVWMRLQKNLFEISASHLLELCRKYFLGKLGITFSALKLWGNFKQKSSKINDPTCRCCWTPCRGTGAPHGGVA